MDVTSRRAVTALAIASMLTIGSIPAMAASPGPADVPAPVCGSGAPPSWVTDASNPNDGAPDPAGRIVFGKFITKDPTYGQLATLYAIDPDGSDLTMLTDCQVEYPHVSPDGTRITFSIRMDNGSMQVATMAIDGTDLRILTTSGHNEYPSWSPDGSWLVFSGLPDADLLAINQCIGGSRPGRWARSFRPDVPGALVPPARRAARSGREWSRSIAPTLDPALAGPVALDEAATVDRCSGRR